MQAETDDDNPLAFFSTHQERFSSLAQLAKQLFCVPATSVPAESLFSMAGIIQTDLRNRLNPRSLEMICFLKQNQYL